jgi:hypothetical protein
MRSCDGRHLPAARHPGLAAPSVRPVHAIVGSVPAAPQGSPGSGLWAHRVPDRSVRKRVRHGASQIRGRCQGPVSGNLRGRTAPPRKTRGATRGRADGDRSEVAGRWRSRLRQRSCRARRGPGITRLGNNRAAARTACSSSTAASIVTPRVDPRSGLKAPPSEAAAGRRSRDHAEADCDPRQRAGSRGIVTTNSVPGSCATTATEPCNC